MSILLSIAGGIAIIVTYAIEGAAGGPWGFVVGAVVGAITLAFTYWLAILVAPAVEQWINRSIVGKNEGKIQKFDDSKSELNALKMTMQGVYVEIGSKMARIDWSDCEDTANSTSKCDTRLCSLNQFIKHFFRLLESQTLSRS